MSSTCQIFSIEFTMPRIDGDPDISVQGLCVTRCWEEGSAGEMTHVCLLQKYLHLEPECSSRLSVAAMDRREGQSNSRARGCLRVQGVGSVQHGSDSLPSPLCFLLR